MSNPGDLDASFNNGGVNVIGIGGAQTVSILFDDNKQNIIGLAAAFSPTSYAINLFKIRTIDGNLNQTSAIFGSTINWTKATSMSIVYSPNQEIFVVGDASSNPNQFFIARRQLVNLSLITGVPISYISIPNTTSTKVTSSLFDNVGLVIGGSSTTSSSAPTYSSFTLHRRTVGTSTTSIDNSFGTSGLIRTDFGGVSAINALKKMPDGKIIAVGYAATTVGGPNYFALARYNSNGTLDTSFGTNRNGKVTTDFSNYYSNAYAYSIEIDSSNNLVVVGKATTSTNRDDIALARYDSSGILDPTFGSGGKLTSNLNNDNCVAKSVKIDSKGRIVIAGYIIQQSVKNLLTLRCTSTGQTDTTFGTNGYVVTVIRGTGNSEFNSLLIDASNNITISGYIYSISNNTTLPVVARYIGDSKPVPLPPQPPIVRPTISLNYAYSNNSPPAFSDNSKIFYKPNSVSSCEGGGTTKNARHKSYKT
jgi:uncharacterized delta-60 repeat protein